MTGSHKAALIADALLGHASTLEVGSPPLPISFPEVSFDPKVDAPDGRYLEVRHLPNVPMWEGLASGALDQGLFQIDVVWPPGEGIIRPLEIAAEVAAHFARGTVMASGGQRVKINGEPRIATPLTEDSEVRVPVTIRWTA